MFNARFYRAMLAMLWVAAPLAPLEAADRSADIRRGLLSEVESWHYQLQRVDVDQLTSTRADLIVIDYAAGRPQQPLKRADVARLKHKPTGGRRVVLAYLSVGEAEEYRFYWRAEWKQTRPSWLVGENCNWPRNHLVRFWANDWKAIIMSGADSYLARIQDAGFDGVYLDLIDAYEPLQRERGDARAQMIGFVSELAGTARRREPGFLVFPQNADELLVDRDYRNVIDGIGRESLLFREGQGRRSPEKVRARVERLRLLRAAGKPVLVVEYVGTAEDAATAREGSIQHGFVPVIATRALDGRDPLMPKSLVPVPSTKAPAAVQATTPQPERACVSY